MKESGEDLMRLQGLLDRGVEHAGSFLRSSFQMPEHSLSASQLSKHLHGPVAVALATVTSRGEPRVAPTIALFYKADFYVLTVATAARARHARERPAVSLTHYSNNDLAIIVHGQAELIPRDHPDFMALEGIQRDLTGSSVLDWGEGIYLRVRAEAMYTYASRPEEYQA